MKIKDILAKGLPSVSFEIFPPRSDSPFEPVKEAVERLARQRPSFMSVTYGASGNAQANTVEVASFVQKCGVPALAHLTCIAATKDSIDGEVAALRSAGIENVLCLRGDLPKGAEEQAQGPFQHAVDLARPAARRFLPRRRMLSGMPSRLRAHGRRHLASARKSRGGA